jgi:hypothetical protein
MRQFLPLFLLVSCSNAQRDREACYARAEAASTQAALACPGSWDDCPDRPRILAELKARQEACK